MTAIAIGLPSFRGRFANDRSIAASSLEKIADEQWPSESSSLSVDHPFLESATELLDAALDATEVGWDGYDASPVTVETIEKALALLFALPSTAVAPEVSVHPDGEIALHWSMGPRQALTLSISSTGRLSFALLLGHTRLHGSDYFTDELPEVVALALRQVHSR